MKHLKITVYSHHFSVTDLTERAKQLCLAFCRQFVQYGFVPVKGTMVRTPVKVFASATVDRGEFRFHINCLNNFKQNLVTKNWTEFMYEIIEVPMYEPAKVELIMKPQWVARDYQVPIIEYLQQQLPVSKLVGIATGRGKGFVSLMAMSKIGQRVCIIVRASYVEKWVEEILATYEINKEDILLIQGTPSLMKLLMMAKENRVTAKIIIISNMTFNNWMKQYEKFQEDTLDMGYDILPFEFFERLQIGVRLIDEIHQHFHGCFRTDTFTHVPQSIALSATMISDDPFIERMHELAYPVRNRYKDTQLIKYIHSHAIHYRFKKPDLIKTTEYGSNNFSMGAVEKSIMKHFPTMKNYFDLINYAIEISYLMCERKNKRMLIFAYSVDLISDLVIYLKKKYPQFDIRRYVSEDEYSNLMEADICVSTLGSSGTGVDIKDLTTVILTTSVNSIQSNVQGLGRLRKLEDGTPVNFYYFVSDDIDKSVQYHYSKKTMLLERCATFNEIYSGYVV